MWPYEVKMSFTEGTIEIEGSADQGEMGEGLREVAEGFPMVSRFFRKKPDMISISEHLLEQEAGFV